MIWLMLTRRTLLGLVGTATGVAALTASERRVAQMAARGASNPEIAQALFVTRATVESHLHAAYGKLGISSRQKLAGALDAADSRDGQSEEP